MAEIGKRFGPHWILSHVNLTIRPGESVALFGKNGSGKSTLLKMIATLLDPTTGQIRLLGREARRHRIEIRNRLRILTHEKQLYDSLTVFENLKLAAGLRGLSQGTTEITSLLEKVQLTKMKDRRISELSEGMKKRVVLARLLLGPCTPDLILLDEPHPTLDTEGKELLTQLIQGWRAKKITLLLSSHDHELALRHVDRLLILQDGRIHYDGAPK